MIRGTVRITDITIRGTVHIMDMDTARITEVATVATPLITNRIRRTGQE